LLKIINGIEIIKHRCSNINEFKYYFKRLKSNVSLPLMLQTDVFDCPWTPFYMKRHIRHSVLVVDIDEKLGLIYCLDPFFTDELVEMPFHELKAKTKYYFLEFSSCEFNPSINNIISILIFTIKRYRDCLLEKNYYNTLMELISRFYNETLTNENAVDYKVRDLPLLRHFKIIERDRNNYAFFLTSLGESFNIDTTYIANKCCALSKTWSSFRILILRDTLKKNQQELMNNADQLICDILAKEQELCNSLINFFEICISQNNSDTYNVSDEKICVKGK